MRGIPRLSGLADPNFGTKNSGTLFAFPMSLTTCRRAITSYSPTFIRGSSKQVLRPRVGRNPFRALSVESSKSASEASRDEELREEIQSDLSELQDYLKGVSPTPEDVDQIPSSSDGPSSSRNRSQRSVVLFRTEEHIRTMPMALAILQEAETRYGKALEFKFAKVRL